MNADKVERNCCYPNFEQYGYNSSLFGMNPVKSDEDPNMGKITSYRYWL